MLSIDETIQNVEKLYHAVTGRPVPPTDTVYAPIPAEKDPIEHVEEQLSRLLSAVGQSVQGEAPWPGQNAAWAPPLSIWESEREMLLSFEVPGVTREHVEVVVQGNILTVKGQRPSTKEELKLRVSERPLGPFRRTVPLPAGVKTGEPTAHMRDGLLEVRIPKENRDAAARPVQIQVG